jgi:hypothetical protein
VAYIESAAKDLLIARDLILSIRKLAPGVKVEHAIGACQGAE